MTTGRLNHDACKMKVLVTGFAPFGGEPTNPSLDAVMALPEKIDSVIVIRKSLPVEFVRAPEVLHKIILAERPDAVICVGQAGGRAEVCVERIAVNKALAKHPDNAGFTPSGEKIITDAPAAYFSTMPVDALAEAVRRGGVPCRVSNTAGLYVCNTLLYCLLHSFPVLPACFVHVPYSPAQAATKPAGTPSMAIPTVTSALTLLVRAIEGACLSDPIGKTSPY